MLDGSFAPDTDCLAYHLNIDQFLGPCSCGWSPNREMIIEMTRASMRKTNYQVLDLGRWGLWAKETPKVSHGSIWDAPSFPNSVSTEA